MKAVQGSLKRLRTEYLDVLLRRRRDTLIEQQEVAEAFGVLHRGGQVRSFGVSDFGLMVELSAAHINAEDCYGFVVEEGKKAAIVFEVEKFPEAEKAIAATSIRLIPDEETYRLQEGRDDLIVPLSYSLSCSLTAKDS